MLKYDSVYTTHMLVLKKQMLCQTDGAHESRAFYAVLHCHSEEYKKLKEERSQVLWTAVERVIPGGVGSVSSSTRCSPN
jgi:hypothetical protein